MAQISVFVFVEHRR